MTAAALLLVATAVPTVAGPMLDWDPALFWEAGATPHLSLPGGDLFVVGIVSQFGAPLDFLDANDPTKEYTFYLFGLDSQGTIPTPVPPLGNAFMTKYNGGIIQVWEGMPRDAVFAANPPNAQVPSTFTDDTMILVGNLSGFYTQTNDFTNHYAGNAEGTITWTGGTLFSYVSPGGQPCPSLFTGGLTWNPAVMASYPGYLFLHDGTIDLDCPTPTESSTWGRVKALYR